MAPKRGTLRSTLRKGGGWAPLRRDAPGRQTRATGKFPDFATAAAREAAVRAVRMGVYAASSLPGVRSRRRFLRKALAGWDQVPYPQPWRRSSALRRS